MTRRFRSAGYAVLALASACVGTAALIAQQPSDAVPVLTPIAPQFAWYSAMVTLLLTIIPWATGGIAGGFARSAADSMRGKAAWEFAALRDTLAVSAVVGIAAGWGVGLWWGSEAQFVAAVACGCAAPELVHAWIAQVRDRSPQLFRRLLRRTGGDS